MKFNRLENLISTSLKARPLQSFGQSSKVLVAVCFSLFLGSYFSQQSQLAQKVTEQDTILKQSMNQTLAIQDKLEQIYQKELSLWQFAEPSIISPDQAMDPNWAEPRVSSSLSGHLKQIEKYSEKILLDLDYTIKQVANNQDIASHFPTQMPANGLISSQYGYRDSPFATHQRNNHKGLDISGKWGSAIYAAGRGIVRTAKYIQSYGNFVDIDHGNGIITRYAHASKLLVRRGQFIQPGQMIAKIGSTGRSTGPHLHFEVLLNGRPVDPENFLFKKPPYSENLALDKPSKDNTAQAIGGGSL